MQSTCSIHAAAGVGLFRNRARALLLSYYSTSSEKSIPQKRRKKRFISPKSAKKVRRELCLRLSPDFFRFNINYAAFLQLYLISYIK